eukprot:3820918-Prymnesium_polylepis.1
MVMFCSGFFAIARERASSDGLLSFHSLAPPCRSLAAASQPRPSFASASRCFAGPSGSCAAIAVAARLQ